MVLVAGRGAAGGEDRVGLGAAVERGGDGIGGVGGVAEVEGLHLPAAQDLGEHRAVGVVGLVRRGGAAGRADLVAGGEDRDPEAAADLELGEADGGGEREIRGAEAAALGQDLGPGGDVLAGGAGVGAGPRRPLEGDGVAVADDVLVEDDGVDARREEGAGQDAQRVAGRDSGAMRRAGGGAARRERQAVRRRAEARVGEAVAVDGGVGGGRVRAAGADSRRQDAAAGVGERHGLDGGDGRHARGEAGERDVGRHPVDAGRQGEAIVAGRAHRRPTRVRMKSAIAGTSSRSKTGTARPASGASEATASTVSSPAAMRSCAVAARRTSIFGWRSRL